MSKYIIVNDDFLPAAAASVLITDLAIQRGYGIFDFFKTIDGQLMFIDDHLDRFFHSAAEMHLPIHKSRTELEALLLTLMEKNDLHDSGIRITLTGGYSPDGYTLAEPNMIITQSAFSNPDFNSKGIKLMTHEHQRQLAQVKTLDYLMAIRLQPLVKQQGADDILYHYNGIVKECPRANFFIVTKDNEVITTTSGILKGVVRKQLLKMSDSGFSISERDINLEDLRQCKEAFITSSTKNILPVTAIDGQLIGDGTAGEVTTALAEKFKEVIITGMLK
ncbi:aminotransferase class IV [Pedobacter immunditicola]|uniref:aminotransferase class IV n=1 Tax=Pedobacter immunditicola TaxID=3133440 RepID=UPI0030A58DDA